ncbi:MAG: DNA recombination/repair protein RecA, partial [Oscillospiraceae bacterium]|nr:DNA recombination/repair protein RecA [Oscillospiraceae bacterium]
IVNKSGAWFSYGDVRLGQGRDNAKEYFRANPALAKEVEDKVFAAMEKAKAEGLNPLGPERKKGKTVLSTAPAAEAPAAEQPAEKPATKRRNANIDIDVE